MNDLDYAVDITNLHRSYGDQNILSDLTLKVPKGSIY